jgi:hypothetical protein
VNELQTEQAEIPGRLLTKDASGNWRCFVGHQPCRGGRWRRNGQLNNLLRLKDMRGRNAGAGRADIQGLGELNKVNTESVGATKENRDLNADTGVLSLVGRDHRFLCL